MMRLLSIAYRHRHRPTTLSSKLLRDGSILQYNFSTSSRTKKKKDDDNTLHQLTSTDQINATTRSVGQVIFLNSLQSSRVLFASLVIADPQLACLAALGGATSTSTAKLIGLDKKTYNDGLWGYNGVLIGCASSVFGPAYLPHVVLSTLLGSAATPILSASLKNAISMPQWTWSFNIAALTSLMRSRPLLESSSSTADASEVVITNTPGYLDVLSSPLLGISQIFVVGSSLTGAGILGSIYMYSPKLSYHALGGSITGCVVGLLSGANLNDVALGLWGYNSALCSMAVGNFFVHSRQTMVLSASSAVASAALFGGMQTLCGTYGIPCLTLPFCTVASACYLLEGQIPGLNLASAPHSPEKNK